MASKTQTPTKDPQRALPKQVQANVARTLTALRTTSKAAA